MYCYEGTVAPAAARPPTVGKKLLTPAAKATSSGTPSAASAPVKAPIKVPAKAQVKFAITPMTGEAPAGNEPTAKGKGKGKASDAEKAPKAPRAKNAYMFFMADKRDAVKGELVLCYVPMLAVIPSVHGEADLSYTSPLLDALLDNNTADMHAAWLSNITSWCQLRVSVAGCRDCRHLSMQHCTATTQLTCILHG